MCDCRGGCGEVSRREFLQSSTAAALGALLASACGDGIIGGAGLTGPAANLDGFSIRLADYPALATVGGMAVITGAPVPLAAVRSSAASYDVFSLACPHAGTTVTPGGGGFRCPNHGATWNTAGTWTGGQRTTDLVKLQTTLDTAAGTLMVSGGGGNVDLTIRLSSFPALAAIGGVARVDGNTTVPIGVARLGVSTYAAYGLACPHEQYVIDPTGSGWRCSKHGARFAPDGALLEGPAETGLTALMVTLDASTGTLRIRGSAVPGNRDDDD
ncbi:MAG: Rieske 2Fe-2S domain-containing protein [Gemmatimonadales bacterium]|nr:Rieske 2Fe-2S domain-containing protein [Gemmatimonadales bacterium]